MVISANLGIPATPLLPAAQLTVPDNPRFRMNAKSFLLTYPHCDLPKEELYAFLLTFGQPVKWVICREQHSDGSPHLHCAVMFQRKLDVRSAIYFDVPWHGTTYHGNYQTIKRWPAAVAYVKKGNSFRPDI